MTNPNSAIRILQMLALCMAICVLLGGCGKPDESVAVAIATVSTPAPTPAKEQVETKPPAEESKAKDAPTNETKTSENRSQAAKSFKLPFPDRIELFVAPKRQGHGIKKSADGIDNAVELLGFVNVDGQRAVLSIDGLVMPLAEGSQKAGIKVISIKPPSVVLQRGRQRWQVNLEY